MHPCIPTKAPFTTDLCHKTATLLHKLIFSCRILSTSVFIPFLGKAISFQTVSYNSTYTNETALEKLHEFLAQNYPDIFGGNQPYIDVHEVNKFSRLIRVEGRTPTKNPFLLCAHLDVVPVVSGQWSRHPFSGEIYRVSIGQLNFNAFY